MRYKITKYILPNFYKFLLLTVCFVLLNVCVCFAQQRQNVKRFFGFHFDFHSQLTDKHIGKDFNYEQLDNFLQRVKPDYIQVDTKGHHGISSYPTSVGTDAKSFDKDILVLWRELTKKYNIELYSHYSGVIDEEAVKEHKNWARVNEKGETDNAKISIFGNYADSLLIPQLKELIDRYNIDGVWLDGDTWALEPDYSTSSRDAYSSYSGERSLPSANNGSYAKFVDFNREQFIKFLGHISNEIHAYNPDFKITDNWAYSSMMPEKPDVDLDFLSGDLSPKNWISNAAFQSRCFASYNIPWDLMAWSFSDKGLKPANLLFLEASETIAMGGGFNSYWLQNRDGSVNSDYFPLITQLSDFCRSREEYCYNTKVIPQIGVFFSNESWKKETSALYGSSGSEAISGIITMLLDNQYPASVVMEYQLEDLKKYPLVIIPEWEFISSSNKDIFRSYVLNGGNLLIMGTDAAANFEDELGVDFSGKGTDKDFVLRAGNEKKKYELPAQIVEPGGNTKIIDFVYEPNNSGKEAFPLSTVTNWGQGKIGGFYINAGKYYYDNNNNDKVIRSTLRKVIDNLYTKPLVKVIAQQNIHLSETEKNNKVYLHLINVNGFEYRKPADFYNNILPAENLQVEIMTVNKPSKIILQPGGINLDFSFNNGISIVKIPRIEIYSILELIM